MLVFHSHCQLGNQMFIYACARSLAKKRKLNYCLSDNKQLIEYFDLSDQDKFLNTLKYQFFRIKNKIVPSSHSYFHFQDNRNDYAETLKKEPSKNAWYYGYFQGLNYFIENQEEVKKLFTIRLQHQNKFNLIIDQFPKEKKILVVHIRLKDYRTFGSEYLNGPDMTLPFAYYHKLLNSYPLEDYQVIFTSDEIETVKKEFQNMKQAYFSEYEAIIDFQFIKNADVALISNSTFAWWAAWLNDKADKQIMVPEYFLGFKIKEEYPINIIPVEWTKVAVS